MTATPSSAPGDPRSTPAGRWGITATEEPAAARYAVDRARRAGGYRGLPVAAEFRSRGRRL
jgi:hypothetical protein